MRLLYPFQSRAYVGQGWLLYCGPLQHLETHRYGAAVLHVGVYRPFRLRLADGEWRECQCAVVPPGVPHALDLAGGVHGKLFVERDSPHGAGFRRRFPWRDGVARRFRDADTVELFRWVFEADPDRRAVESRLDGWLGGMADGAGGFDARIRTVIQVMAREPDRNFSQEALAGLIGLSPSRFLHLFRESTGVPYRRFRQWRRLLAAIGHLHAGDNLTRAALEAGFADAAHFSHCFRDAFGVNPAPVFRRIERFEVGPVEPLG